MSFTRVEVQQLLIDTIVHHAPLPDVVKVLNAGADPNGAVQKGLRPLHYATHANNLGCMALLIKCGADVNLDDDLGYTCLHIAAKHGFHQAMELLLVHGAIACNVESPSDKLSEKTANLAKLGVHPLNSALESNHARCTELLLQHGCNPDQHYFMGHELNLVPLENVECLEVLLKHGADPNVFSRGGLTTLMKACRTRYLAAAQLLIKYNADVNLECAGQFDRKRALHYSVESGDIDICRLLLESGGDTSLPPNFKFSPLEDAIHSDQEAICDLLLVFGADANETNTEDCIPLQVACSSPGLTHQKGIIATLLRNGANPRLSSSHLSCTGPCLTSLVEYISCNDDLDIHIIMDLIQHGAYVNFTMPSLRFKIRDPFGVMPHVKKFEPNAELFNLLMGCAYVFDKNAIGTVDNVSKQTRERLLEESNSVRTLKHICRHYVRRGLRVPLPNSVPSLPLPAYLMKYIQFTIR